MASSSIFHAAPDRGRIECHSRVLVTRQVPRCECVAFPCESLNRASPLRDVVTCLSPGLVLDHSNMHTPLTDIASSLMRTDHPEDGWQHGPCISYRIFSACLLLPTLLSMSSSMLNLTSDQLESYVIRRHCWSPLSS